MEVYHQKLVSNMIKSADGGTGFLHKIPNQRREEVDAKPLARCEEKRKEWAKHCQSDTMGQDLQDKSWRNGELKTLDGDMPRLLEKELQMAAESCKAKTGEGCDFFHPMVPLDFRQKEQEEKWWNSWREWSSAGDGRSTLAQQ